jgi:hypothetical protein
MMTKEGRLKLTFGQKIDHYFIVVFLLLVPSFTAYDIYKMYVTHTYDGVRTASELLTFSLPFLILAVAFIFIQRSKLKFQEIKLDHSDDQFQAAVKLTIQDLKWDIEHNDVDYFRAYRPWNWTSSWGEMITIIRDKERLYINCICDPNKTSSVVSWGWNKRNIKTFLTKLTDARNVTERTNEKQNY